MNISWLTLRDLEYLVAVAEHLHFGKAAKACNVSQPALSGQIKKVEGYLGIPLFERSKKRVALTRTGERAVNQARVVLAEAKKIAELAHDEREPLSGPLRLGAIASLGPYLIPHVLAPLRRKYPKTQLLLREGLTDGLIRELREGKLDAVLASPTFPEQGLRTFPLFWEPFLVAAPNDHPILERTPLRASDLRAEHMVLLEDGHCLKDQTLNFCPTNRRGNLRQFQATGVETLRGLVASGLGYTLLPSLAVPTGHEDQLKGLIRYRHFQDRKVGRIVALYCREQFPGLKDMELLARLIQASVPSCVERLTASGSNKAGNR